MEKGAQQIKAGNVDWVFLCGLYWGEGSKERHSAKMTNSDPHLLCAYLAALRRAFPVVEAKFRASLHCYGSAEDAQRLVTEWSTLTGIPVEQFGKTQLNKVSPQSKNLRAGACPLGTLRVAYHSTELLYMLYGGIAQLAGRETLSWADR
jgi:hypothetical protein